MPGWDIFSCFTGTMWDPDRDGVDNGCENALAAAFAPELALTTADCDWDYSLDRMGGEYFFAVQKAPAQGFLEIRIAYLPAYYWDCGVRHDAVDQCYAPLVGECNGHTGDSEFILVDAKYESATGHWVTQRVFLSAHCGTITGNECRWVDTSRFNWYEGRTKGAPIVWVSEKKHANYPSQDACNTGVTIGIFENEHCDLHNRFRRFPVVFGQQNVGSRATPMRDCAVAFSNSAMVAPSAVECIWTDTGGSFNGWQGTVSNGGSTLYSQHLMEYAEF